MSDFKFPSRLNCMSLSPNGKYIAIADEATNNISIYDIRSKKLQTKAKKIHPVKIRRTHFSITNQTVLFSDEKGKLFRLSVADGGTQEIKAGHPDPILAIDTFIDRVNLASVFKILTAGMDGKIRLTDGDKNQSLKQ
mmetsp:Transcript_28185/g.24977  ORF Transcript_28185/g.24977 Transcript_28185/m.24977 type:complete len:137 (+) Transcript_28185:1461-1871(+)